VSRRGQALVQWALALPLTALMALGAVGYGWVGYSFVQVSGAARQSVEWLAAGATPCQVWTAASQMLEAARPFAPPVLVFTVHSRTGTTRCALPAYEGLAACAPAGGWFERPGERVEVRMIFTGTTLVPVPGFIRSGYQLSLGASGRVGGHVAAVTLPASCPTG
jgi:hypothetical protein